ncbi:MAG: single-stranded-DNA-specific exonuclease RecJ [Anaerolineae bacterium]|nr:single-stranded-DNA-specific exonuclease RecJ [Anaerolineae bacterium]
MAKTWRDPQPIEVPDELRAAVGGHPLVAAQLVRRGIVTAEAARRFLDPLHYAPASPADLPDMEQAVERIRRALQRQETILIWGDFDVDGQTATALLVSALQGRGAHLRHHIPNRFDEGHGIHLETLRGLLDGVDVLLTCDTGVAAHESIEYARSRGVDVVVTDHHALPDTLPQAEAVVNPMRLPEHHPLRELSGVGTAYKLVEALFGAAAVEPLLDLVALGLVADVMVLADDTRYLLQCGLETLRRAERLGLALMMERAEINPLEVNEGHLGFALAPRLNALGRLADAAPAVELLTTADRSRALMLVNQLEGYNAERKLLSNQVYEGVQAQLERDPALLDYAALVIAHPGWHSGVIGVVAGRLAEQYRRPVVLLSIHGEAAQGSARSVQGCDISRALKRLAGLLTRYGGHTMAAGLSLPAENVPEFRRQLSRLVREQLGARAVEASTLAVDALVSLPEVTLELAEQIDRLAPFGNGSPPPALVAERVRVARQRALGRRAEHLELTVEDEAGTRRRVLWWNHAGQEPPAGLFDLAYTLRLSRYRGQPDAQVEWLDARALEDEAVDLGAGAAAYTVIDYRSHPDPASQLKRVLAEHPGAILWREGGGGLSRGELRPARTLIVWEPPPGPDEWAGALDAVQPETVIVFGVDPGWDTLNAFLTRLAGLVKYALKRLDGQIDLGRLAASMNHRESTARTGLEWLAADGQIRLEAGQEPGIYRVSAPGEADPARREAIQQRVEGLLAETRAYRAFWGKTVRSS